MNLFRKTILTLSLSLFLFSCGSVDKSGEVADKFYAAIKTDDFSKAVDLCSEETLQASPKEQWIGVLEDKKGKVGKLESFERFGFETYTNNGVTTTELKFKVKYENKMLYEKIIFKLYGSDYKIYGYVFAETLEELASYTRN